MKAVIIGVIVAVAVIGGYFAYEEMTRPETPGEKIDAAIEKMGEDAERLGQELQDATGR